MIARKKTKYKEISKEPHSQILFTDLDELHITGYQNSVLKSWIFYLLNLPLCGAPFLLLDWYPQFIYWKYLRCSLKSADKVLVKDSYEVHSIHKIQSVSISFKKTSAEFQKSIFTSLRVTDNLKYFIYKDMRYIWLNDDMQFYQLKGLESEKRNLQKFIETCTGYDIEEQSILLQIYGKNEIKLSMINIWRAFIKEIFRPFYVFQIFSVVLWMCNDYISYAICVVILSGWSIFITLFTARKQRISLRNLVRKSVSCTVPVVRKNGGTERIHPSFLVPGDIIQIPQDGCIMPCDALLLHGNCIVNESVLTGESCPVIKTPFTNTEEPFNSIISKSHILFCGTKVLQTRYYGEGMVTAVTIKTGFSTIKGELIRTLLHPKPFNFKFYEDTVKFIFCLFFIAVCGIVYFLYASYKRNIPLNSVVMDSLDLITIVVPPSLPAALTAGISYSKSRLLSKGIFCISPPKINVFGKLKLMCFDKTGTLTEEGFNLYGVIPCYQKKFQNSIDDPSLLDIKHPVVVTFAACHSLTKINGNVSGDPLDLSMFNSLNWDLLEPGNDTARYDLLCPTIVKPKTFMRSKESVKTGKQQCEGINTLVNLIDVKYSDSVQLLNETTEIQNICNYSCEDLDSSELPYEIGIVREFPFTALSRCMSVITRELGSTHMNLYCKGAPEKIYELCNPDSLPLNFSHELQTHASMGFRILGMAYKQFDQKFTWRKSQRAKREEVEHNLIFLGFILLQNKLKKMSMSVINDLRKASIRCVMITGDNLLTALSVSRECFLILPGENVMEIKVTTTEHENMPLLTFQPLEPIHCSHRANSLKFSLNSTNSDPQESKNHYAIDGKTWELLRTHFSDLIPKIIVKGTVFARMLPEQKTQIVEALQSLDYIVGMCGDGANDIGAMKAAHVSVSLSEAESSVAAPFTSKIQDISCIVNLVQEGRCALVSTFVIFKYMAMYGLIQFVSVLIAYSKGVSFGNVEFLYVDLVVTSLLTVVIGRTGPAKKLVKTRPIARLISFGNLFPLALQVLILFLVQMLAVEFLSTQPWFVPVEPDAETESWENTVIYSISLFQFIILALVYSKGKPYRQPFYKDIGFMTVVVAMALFTILLCVYPFQQLATFFELVPVELGNSAKFFFRIELLLFPLLNLILSICIETALAERKWLKNIVHFVTRKKGPKNLYKRILLDSDCRFT